MEINLILYSLWKIINNKGWFHKNSILLLHLKGIHIPLYQIKNNNFDNKTAYDKKYNAFYFMSHSLLNKL